MSPRIAARLYAIPASRDKHLAPVLRCHPERSPAAAAAAFPTRSVGAGRREGPLFLLQPIARLSCLLASLLPAVSASSAPARHPVGRASAVHAPPAPFVASAARRLFVAAGHFGSAVACYRFLLAEACFGAPCRVRPCVVIPSEVPRPPRRPFPRVAWARDAERDLSSFPCRPCLSLPPCLIASCCLSVLCACPPSRRAGLCGEMHSRLAAETRHLKPVFRLWGPSPLTLAPRP
jgi:hypothetical protein